MRRPHASEHRGHCETTPCGFRLSVMARPKHRLERWQTLLAAALAAAAAIAVALIQVGGDASESVSSGATSSASSTPQAAPTSPAPSVAISTVTILSQPPPNMRLTGSAVGLSQYHDIYVIARPDTGEPNSHWIASSPVKAAGEGFWQVDFQLPPDVPMPCRFLALVLSGDRGNATPDPAGEVNTLAQILEEFGPDVVATSVEVVGP